MNVKVHTPKSLKGGSGMSSRKQFLLSLLATTVSIVLTFGTAAIIDGRKKQKAKHEIVMMVMYDMYKSLQQVEEADSMLDETLNLKIQLAKDTSFYPKYKKLCVKNVPKVEFSEATERIFSTSIETINTVGNVLFTENVSTFYHDRQRYKELVCDSFLVAMLNTPPLISLKNALDEEPFFLSVQSKDIRLDLRRYFEECKLLMNISEEEIKAYRKERELLDERLPEYSDSMKDVKVGEIIKRYNDFNESKIKLKLE